MLGDGLVMVSLLEVGVAVFEVNKVSGFLLIRSVAHSFTP